MAAEPTHSAGRPGGRPRWKAGLLLAGLSAALSLLAVEVGVRRAWSAQPEGVYPGDTGCCRQGALLPGIEGHDRFHRFRHNALGYRGPEHQVGRREGARIVMVGDSFVYGVGVDEQRSLPGQLQARLQRMVPGVEVVNGGVPGGDLETGLARVDKAARDYQPDLVLLVLLFNDLELGSSASGGVRAPQLQTSWVRDQGAPTWMWHLGHQMLPLPDPARGQKAPPGPEDLRFRLARGWRTWMYAGLELQRVGYRWEQSDRNLSLFHHDSRQVERIAWQRTRQALDRFAAQAAGAGFQPGVVMFQYGPLEGIPALAMDRILAESGLPVLNLDPLWGGYANYARQHSFRFDLHPNPAAHAQAADTVAAWIASQGWLGATPDAPARAWATAWPAQLQAWQARQQAQAAEQKARLRGLEATYRDTLPAPDAPADQWLYGWWMHPQPGGETRIHLARQGGFKLRAGPGGARHLRVEGRRLEGQRLEGQRLEGQRLDRPEDPPLSLGATCEGQALGPAVAPVEPDFVLERPLLAPLAPGELVECELTASGLVAVSTASAPGPSAPGPSAPRPSDQASFHIQRLALVP